MRPDEQFVAQSLVNFLGGSSSVSIEDGEDPPDVYLNLGVNRIGVEVTRLSQFAVDPNGKFYMHTVHFYFLLFKKPWFSRGDFYAAQKATH